MGDTNRSKLQITAEIFAALRTGPSNPFRLRTALNLYPYSLAEYLDLIVFIQDQPRLRIDAVGNRKTLRLEPAGISQASDQRSSEDAPPALPAKAEPRKPRPNLSPKNKRKPPKKAKPKNSTKARKPAQPAASPDPSPSILEAPLKKEALPIEKTPPILHATPLKSHIKPAPKLDKSTILKRFVDILAENKAVKQLGISKTTIALAANQLFLLWERSINFKSPMKEYPPKAVEQLKQWLFGAATAQDVLDEQVTHTLDECWDEFLP